MEPWVIYTLSATLLYGALNFLFKMAAERGHDTDGLVSVVGLAVAVMALATLTFTVPRPSSRTNDRWPHLKPSRTCPDGGDIDKLTRLLLDAFTDAGVWTDDSRVIAINAVKTYPDAPVPDSLDSPGATITINTLPTEQDTLL